MNELIQLSDPIEPVEQDGMLFIAPDHRPKGGAFRGLIVALPAAILCWVVIFGGLYLYFKRG